jgi:hypothetical protein
MRILAGDASYLSLWGQFGKKKGGKAGVAGDEILKIKYANLPCVSADTPSE